MYWNGIKDTSECIDVLLELVWGFDVWNCFHDHLCIAVGRSDWYRLVVSLCFVTGSPPTCERRLLNTPPLKDVTADFISVNGFYETRNTGNRKGRFCFICYISSAALRRKKWLRDYCHTFFCTSTAECLLIPVCMCCCLYFWVYGECGCVRAGNCVRLWMQLCFSTCKPHCGEVWAARSRVGRTSPPEQGTGKRWHVAERWTACTANLWLLYMMYTVEDVRQHIVYYIFPSVWGNSGQ